MSVPVELADLAGRIAERGPVAFLVTVAPDAAPHVVSVAVSWSGEELAAGAGRSTSSNVDGNPSVSLVWPAVDGGPYGLIVDGAARVLDGEVRVRPTAAVLHRVADADAALPSCVRILSAPGPVSGGG